VRHAAADLDVRGLAAGPQKKEVEQMTTWELANLPPTEALDLRERFVLSYVKQNREMADREARPAAVLHHLDELVDARLVPAAREAERGRVRRVRVVALDDAPEHVERLVAPREPRPAVDQQDGAQNHH